MTVARVLRSLNFSTRVNVKRFTGPPHPDRDIQFQYIGALQQEFFDIGLPVVSVDTKKKELIGEFKNDGTRWVQRPDVVNAHDFRQDAEFLAVPYGIYDLQNNLGHVTVGISRDTSQFAVDAIRCWWRTKGVNRYSDAGEILIHADAGGSNGYRRRLWKLALQQWANSDGLIITVCHYPTGASKWNPIEHRLFSQISNNWAGTPLRNLDVMLRLMRGTKTRTGLKVTVNINTRRYQSIKVHRREMAELDLRPHEICPHWNYSIYPQT